jgi:hypothetical protein
MKRLVTKFRLLQDRGKVPEDVATIDWCPDARGEHESVLVPAVLAVDVPRFFFPTN